MMGIGMNQKIVGRKKGHDVFARETMILILENGSELVMGRTWWERANKPDIGDHLILTINKNPHSSASSRRSKDDAP